MAETERAVSIGGVVEADAAQARVRVDAGIDAAGGSAHVGGGELPGWPVFNVVALRMRTGTLAGSIQFSDRGQKGGFDRGAHGAEPGASRRVN